MNYRTYSKLTKKQKEEWDYRFKGWKPMFNMTVPIMGMIVICGIILLNIFMSYIIITDTTGKLGGLTYHVMYLTWYMASLLGVMAWAFISMIVIDFGCLIISFVCRTKWLKKNNIPIKGSMRPDWLIK